MRDLVLLALVNDPIRVMITLQKKEASKRLRYSTRRNPCQEFEGVEHNKIKEK